MKVGVATVVHGRREHLLAQHHSLARGTRRPEQYVAVAMGDPGLRPATDFGLDHHVLHVAADPARLPLAAARNLGAAYLLERGCDALVFLDVDCLAGRRLVAAYADALARDRTAVWSGPVTYLDPPPPDGYPLDRLAELDAPHPARPDPGPGRVRDDLIPDLFWSLSFALGAATWQQIGGFCEEYAGYGGEDTDFARAARRHGVPLRVTGDARAYHQWHPVSSPPVEHLDDILRNGALFHRRWGQWPMLGWLEAFAGLGLVERDGDSWRRTQ